MTHDTQGNNRTTTIKLDYDEVCSLMNAMKYQRQQWERTAGGWPDDKVLLQAKLDRAFLKITKEIA